MVVAVDIGNSAMKIAAETDPNAVVRISKGSRTDAYDQQLTRFTQRFCDAHPASWLVCSVDMSQANDLAVWVEKHRPQDQFRTISHDDIPLESTVRKRVALGRDRLLAAWFAASLVVSEPASIVVDAGTAVTIDMTIDKIHRGGLIYPGPGTCLAALESQTDALPNLSIQPVPEVSASISLGNSTQQAILLGVHQLQLFGTVAMVGSLQKQNPNARVFCCGGALEAISDQLPQSWTHQPTLITDAILELSKRIF